MADLNSIISDNKIALVSIAHLRTESDQPMPRREGLSKDRTDEITNAYVLLEIYAVVGDLLARAPESQGVSSL